MHPTLWIFLFITLVLWIGFHPRKPFVIHAYMNKMFMKAFFLLDFVGIGCLMAWIYIYSITVLTPYEIPEIVFLIVPFIIVGLACLAMIYTLYWNLPFSRKTKGVEKVDRAIERYRKPKEEVAGAWMPDLIVDGKIYTAVTYHIHGRATGILALDMDGHVVRDLDLMNKIECCSRLVMATAYPPYINQRTSDYTRSMTGRKQLELAFKIFPRLIAPIEAKEGSAEAAHVANIWEAMQVMRRYSANLCEQWEMEAEWGNQRGNAHLREGRYEEIMELSRRVNQKLDWLLLEKEKAGILIAGAVSAKALQRLMNKRPEINRKSPDLKHLLELLVIQKEIGETVMRWQEAGEVPVRYRPMTEEEQRVWRERLEWVDQVDGGKA